MNRGETAGWDQELTGHREVTGHQEVKMDRCEVETGHGTGMDLQTAGMVIRWQRWEAWWQYGYTAAAAIFFC